MGPPTPARSAQREAVSDATPAMLLRGVSAGILRTGSVADGVRGVCDCEKEWIA